MHADPLNVFRFLKRVVHSIFPVRLWTKKYIPLINKYIKKLVFYKRFETFSCSEIYEELKKADLKWYARKFNPIFRKDINGNRKAIIAYILHFLFNQLIDFIRANFYVTEKHDGHNTLFFYSKSIWFLIV